MKYSLALALVAGGLAAGGASGWAIADASYDSTASPTPLATPPPAPRSTSRANPSVQLVVFTDAMHPYGIEIAQPADAARLKGTSAAFQQFVGSFGESQARVTAKAGSCGSERPLTVIRYASTGFAYGMADSCMGGGAIYGTRNGTWTALIYGTDPGFACKDLRADGVPPELLREPGSTFSTCYGEPQGQYGSQNLEIYAG